jgi:feruloyl esterase
MRIFLGTMLCATALMGQGGGHVQFRDWNVPAGGAKPKVACATLQSLTNYAMSITSARVVAGSADVPEHCRVHILIQPKLNIEVNLPAAWNGRFYMFGNGGFAGESFDSAGRVGDLSRGLKAGFAVASTDTGHSAAEEPGGTFARNRQELIDFGFRAVHLTAETAKTLIKAYYGEAPSKSYFDGCSQGGREGLILAERFPTDFDGILAGSPTIDFTGGNYARVYWMQGLAAAPVAAAKMQLVADTVYAKCDEKDGLKDGVIDDPRRCDFHPATDLPRCVEGADGASCFTGAEIGSLERVYGDVMSQGKRNFPGWPVGSEIAPDGGRSGWIGEELNYADGRPGAWTYYAADVLRYMAFPETDPASTIAGFDVNRDPQRAGWLSDILDATDPDLSAFRKHDGKLIMYFGWADPQLNPLAGVEYYEKMSAQMGASTTDFARLFMVPGMFHCGGGVGTSVFDVGTPLIQWVESNKAPDGITASRVVSGKVVRTRPLCAYPEVARYKGSGSTDEAGNFACVRP